MVYPTLLLLMRTPRLPVVDWTDDLADLNELVRFAERRNLVSARVPSHFKPSLLNLRRRITEVFPRLDCLDCLTLKIGAMSFPELSTTSYKPTLPNIPEEQRPQHATYWRFWFAIMRYPVTTCPEYYDFQMTWWNLKLGHGYSLQRRF
jgi:hypothetical protein